MENRLIMLPQPILVSDENLKINQPCYGVDINNGWVDTVHSAGSHDVAHKHPKVIAGIIVLPKLDLSLIAEEIGWIDVEKLAIEELGSGYHNYNLVKTAWISGFKAAQSLNEKKYSEEDMRKILFEAVGMQIYSEESKNFFVEHLIEKISKPKEYLVEIIQEGNTIKVTKILKP